jgi:hypothetical protein
MRLNFVEGGEAEKPSAQHQKIIFNHFQPGQLRNISATYSRRVSIVKTKRVLIVSILLVILLAALAVQTALAETVPPSGVEITKKTAEGSYGTKWTWTIDKEADTSSLILSPGQTSDLVNYTVTLSASSVDEWTVSGIITIRNPTDADVWITDVTDVLSDGTHAIVDCSDLWNPLPGGFTSTCTYTASGTGDRPTKNTATAYFDGGSSTIEVDVNYADPVSEVDECIQVVDDQFGSLGKVCADQLPKTFTYDKTFKYDVCGEYQFVNIASFATNDTGSTGSDSWTVDISVPCAGGCSLTPGYWKTHSEFGPAPYDNTWAQLPNGASTLFYLSGKSYYQVLWTPPQGNAYYILAHAFIAAKLNGLNGADTSAISSQLAWAEAFFTVKTPTTQLSKVQRLEVLTKATILDQYNNGYIGPGHCSE